MQSHSESRVRILYEMAMAIGNSLDLDKLLTESLKVMLRKLDGIAIGLYAMRDLTPIHLFPRRGMTEQYHLNLHQAHQAFCATGAEGGGFLAHSLVDKQRHQYLFVLKRVGILSLICPHPIDEGTLNALAPVCDKLATSVRSCYANQRLIEQEKNLQTALCDLQRAQTARDLFLANMSHEIRTPLNGIVGFLGQLEETPLDDNQRHFLTIIRHSSDSLIEIINDILDFSKMDAGKLALEQRPFHLIDTLGPIVELFRSRAQQQRTTMLFRQEGRVPAYIAGDALRLKQIVTNLISNAVKFTQDGQIELIVRCDEVGPQQVRVQIAICDTGIGMAPAQLKSIGEPFAQADASTTRHYGGTGLGVAICKRLIELMGSRLEISSELGKGSQFSFSWLAPIANAPLSNDGVSLLPLQADYGGQRVLLVEDNKVNQLLMQAVLNKMGVTPQIAENGAVAVERVCDLSERYDLILMDINMPIMDGEQATRHIRDYEQAQSLPSTPIVALTANVLKGDRERYLAMGLDEVLAKPIDMIKLHQVFHQCLTPRR
ncbi:MAG: ATP-binding protein [Thiomicrospira sp.]|nr:ATP-binding protein [Thiomicrospira sp.]